MNVRMCNIAVREDCLWPSSILFLSRFTTLNPVSLQMMHCNWSLPSGSSYLHISLSAHQKCFLLRIYLLFFLSRRPWLRGNAGFDYKANLHGGLAWFMHVMCIVWSYWLPAVTRIFQTVILRKRCCCFKLKRKFSLLSFFLNSRSWNDVY